MTPELLKSEADNCDAQSGLSPAPLLGGGKCQHNITKSEICGRDVTHEVQRYGSTLVLHFCEEHAMRRNRYPYRVAKL